MKSHTFVTTQLSWHAFEARGHDKEHKGCNWTCSLFSGHAVERSAVCAWHFCPFGLYKCYQAPSTRSPGHMTWARHKASVPSGEAQSCRVAGSRTGCRGWWWLMKPAASHARLPLSVTLQWMHYWPLHGTDCILNMRRKLASAGYLRSEAAAKPRPTAHRAALSCPLLHTNAPIL